MHRLLLPLAVLAFAACDSGGSDPESSADVLTAPSRTEVEDAGFSGVFSCEFTYRPDSGTVSSTITDDDCRYFSNDTNNAQAELIFFKVTGSTSVRISMTSQAFAPDVTLNSPSAEVGSARAGSPSETATLTSRLSPGVYQVLAGNNGTGLGSFTVTVEAAD